MGYNSYSSFFEVLTVSGFAYAGVPKVTAFFDNNFYSLTTPIFYKKMISIVTKKKELLSSELYLLANTKEDHLYQINGVVGAHKTLFENNIKQIDEDYDVIQRGERACNLFRRTLKPIYLMSAFFGLFMLIILGAENHLMQSGEGLFEAFLFTLEVFVSAFLVYSVLAFRKKGRVLISSNLTLLFFIVFVVLSTLVFLNLFPIKFYSLAPRMHYVGIFSLFLTAFSFIFHFVRQMQIKYLYLFKLYAAFRLVNKKIEKDKATIENIVGRILD